jgi:hypothetical protein
VGVWAVGLVDPSTNPGRSGTDNARSSQVNATKISTKTRCCGVGPSTARSVLSGSSPHRQHSTLCSQESVKIPSTPGGYLKRIGIDSASRTSNSYIITFSPARRKSHPSSIEQPDDSNTINSNIPSSYTSKDIN